MKNLLNDTDYICEHHKLIIKEVEEILAVQEWLKHFIDKNDKNINECDKDEVFQLLDDLKESIINIKKSSKIALVQGQNMENRLRQYRESIESLGFKKK